MIYRYTGRGATLAQIVALLLASGARVSSCAENWKGAVRRCCKASHSSLVVRMIAINIAGEVPLHYACKSATQWLCHGNSHDASIVAFPVPRYGHAKIAKILLMPGSHAILITNYYT